MQLLKIKYNHSEVIVRIFDNRLSIPQGFKGKKGETLDKSHYYY